MDDQTQAHQYLQAERYQEAALIFERILEHSPGLISCYWYLGLAYLLNGREEEAQTTWLLTLAQASLEQAEVWTTELTQILNQEALRQQQLKNVETSWAIRQYIHEIGGVNLENLLHLVQITAELNIFDENILEKWDIIKLVQQAKPKSVDSSLLLKSFQILLNYPKPEVILFAESCLPQIQNIQPWINLVIEANSKIAEVNTDFAADLRKFGLNLGIKETVYWQALSRFYQKQGKYERSIEAAQEFIKLADTLPLKLMANYLLLNILTKSCFWKDIGSVLESYQQLMEQMIEEKTQEKDLVLIASMSVAPSLLQYHQDNLARNRYFQNNLSNLAQECLQIHKPDSLKSGFKKRSQKDKLMRIGFISHALRSHSVGWLARWLYKHLDRSIFNINLYLVNQESKNSFTQEWFNNSCDNINQFKEDEIRIAEKINHDQIDILIDLDSNSFSTTNLVMSLKPAPVQLTWLGFEASGTPAIDYFIADPYVLPAYADEHYSEKIWRLPQTYLAIDGFEVDVPTLRRDHLGIPTDAIIYLSAQSGYKRHPDTIRSQLKIIKDVPNSYFLIKGSGDQGQVQQLFISAAENAGVNPERLRFLDRDPNEFIHRANLKIADVILDTYPYNGATTTLEAMWMGIPLVTRVGEQFSARNSYAFLTNAGVKDGIAWTDEEYIEWGIRLGQDSVLRSKITWQLEISRQTSPLWDTKQFARNMEVAYQQMWQNYQQELV